MQMNLRSSIETHTYDIQTRVSNLLWDKGVEGALLTVYAVSGVKGA